MEESEDLRVLQKITAEVDEAQVKIIFSSQCIKAQTFIADRLRKEAEKQKEACKYLSSGNSKLEAEIENAEQELKSLMVAYETIRSANVETKKELLLAKERNIDLAKRVELGEKRYEDMWVQCKQRFMSIPFVREWFELTNITQELKERVKSLEQEAIIMVKEIKKKKDTLQQVDNSRIIELAKFMIQERPKMLKDLTEKTEKCRKLTTEIARYEKEVADAKDVNHTEKPENPSNVLLEGCWPSLREQFSDVRDSLQLPKLAQPDKDLEMFTVNLEQIKKHANTSTKSTELNTTHKEAKSSKSAGKADIYVSSFFKSYLNTNEEAFSTAAETGPKINAKRRLADLLDDLNMNKDNNYSSNVKPTVMQADNVTEKRYKITNNREINKIQGVHNMQNIDVMEYEEIEETNMTLSASNAILDPPTPFLDMSQNTNYGGSQVSVEVTVHKPMDETATIKSKLRSSQEGNEKKRVSFDLPVIEEEPEEIIRVELDEDKGRQEYANVSSNSQLNLSAGDESFSKMKDMILKKKCLDLSPDFVYAKQAKDAKVVTSKFFKNSAVNSVTDKPLLDKQDGNMESDKPEGDADDKRQGNKDEGMLGDKATSKSPEKIDSFEDAIDCSKNSQTKKTDNFVTGILFNHGSSGLPESLDVSMNTTGFDDADVDFAHGVDASLLLSPKANIPTPMSGETSEVFSQEVPNFLSGLRKSGFSFFGAAPSTNAETDSAAPSRGNNFNFNFGSDNKKNRGGLFTPSTNAEADSAAPSQGNNFNFNFGNDNKKSCGGL